MEIFTNFSHVVGKFLVLSCIVMVICIFRKSVTNVITMLWMIIKSRFNVEFFTLFCNGFTTFSASKIIRMKRLSWWKVPCQSPLEQWQKQRLIKVPNVEVSGFFKDYDFHLVECFIRVSKHEKTDESTRPQAECFYCFRVFGNPDETRCISF